MSDEFKGRQIIEGVESSFGIFYPTGYIVTAIDSYEAAERCKSALIAAGYSEDEVDAVTSKTVISDIEKGVKDADLLTRVKQMFSEAIGTEAGYWENDLVLAKEGAGFLLIYCPTIHEARRVKRLLKSENPKNMRRYAPLVIEDLNETVVNN